MKYPKHITLCEVGPRDGLQNEKKLLTAAQKAELIDACADAGFPVIEVGSFVHPKAVPQMADTDEVFRLIRHKTDTEYRALVANLKGVERAVACGCQKIKLNVSASVAHNLANLNCTPQESVARFQACTDMARENNVMVSGSISMAFGSPWDKEIPLDDVRAIVDAYLKVGVEEISLSDASGMAIPSQIERMGKKLLAEYPQVKWWIHLHNTRGLAIANMLAAMDVGFTRFDTAFAGCGGCPFVPGAAGNVASEDVLHMLDEMNIQTGVDLQKAIAVGHHAEKMLEHPSASFVLKAGTNRELIRELPTKQHK